MVILVYGEDGYRRREKVHELIAKFKEKFDQSGMNTAEFDYAGNDGEIMSAVGAPPFLGDRRMIVICGLAEATTKKADAELWRERLSGRGEETIVVLVDNIAIEKSKKNKLFTALREGEVHEYAFGLMSDREMQTFVQQQAQQLGATWQEHAVRALTQRVGPDTWRLFNEVQKVSSSVMERAVTVEDVEQLVAEQFEDALFAFLDAVRAQNSKRAVQLLQNELGRGTPAPQLLTMIAREVQLLAELRAYASVHGPQDQRGAASELGLHPFVVKKTMSRAVTMEPQLLQRMIGHVLAAEERFKVRYQDPQEVLEQLVVDLVTETPS